jgi:CxxC motif-containing protein (DUF1111 family)
MSCIGRHVLWCLGVGVAITACATEDVALETWMTDVRSGGNTSISDTTRDAYAFVSPALRPEHQNAFFVGNGMFSTNWVTAPASTEGRDGLGPTFNAGSCSACHFKDGRGRPPLTVDEPFDGLLVRLSIPGMGAHGEPVDEPVYGGQFNHRSVPNVPSEGRAVVAYRDVNGRYSEGMEYVLRSPTIEFPSLTFGPMRNDVMTSARVAPSVYGLGLLEAIPEATLVALSDPDDGNRDGISGRVNHVWDPVFQRTMVGRFGWKANQASLMAQNSGAFLGDIGITTTVHPQENCTPSQTVCSQTPNGGTPEVDDSKLAAMLLYTRSLAVPARRDVRAPVVLRGASLFSSANCVACHSPTLRTSDTFELVELRSQTIHPYTDLLLHDMGEGLSDHRPDFEASGQEWRTPPLWGIGLLEQVNRHTFLLHDGRARGVAEAILWHDGEGARARDAFRSMSREDREALVAFVNSL